LLALEQANWEIRKIETLGGGKMVTNPSKIDDSEIFGVRFEKTKIDRMLLQGKIEYTVEDKGIIVDTNKGKILVEFDAERFRPAEVSTLLSDTTKIQKLGFRVKYKLTDIIRDHLNYFLSAGNRQ
jgi:GDPmannose 4,6-dehydratase